jgi:hypothetical protein
MKEFFTQSKEMSHEYCCTVVRVGEVLPIEGSDFLGQVDVEGRTIVVRKDQVKAGDVMFYASNESQLDPDFLHVNNLFESKEMNANPEVKGYFNKAGRVRMVKLRGVVSMGYLFTLDEMKAYCPMINLTNQDLEGLVGFDFDEVNGENFIHAYVPPIPEERKKERGAGKRNAKIAKFNRMIPGEFSSHYDTSQLERNMHRFTPVTNVTASIKLHGCVERDTIVNTKEYGNLTIGEIVDKKIDCHIKAYDTDLEENVYVPIDDYYLMKNDGEWYEIELEDGKKITITGNNPVWLPEFGVYRRVDELSGDELLLADE